MTGLEQRALDAADSIISRHGDQPGVQLRAELAIAWVEGWSAGGEDARQVLQVIREILSDFDQVEPTPVLRLVPTPPEVGA